MTGKFRINYVGKWRKCDLMGRPGSNPHTSPNSRDEYKFEFGKDEVYTLRRPYHPFFDRSCISIIISGYDDDGRFVDVEFRPGD